MYEVNDEDKFLIIDLFHRLEQHQPTSNLSPKGQLWNLLKPQLLTR
jgi:hypothetical protein